MTLHEVLRLPVTDDSDFDSISLVGFIPDEIR